MQNIADNYQCANALEGFKQTVLNPHKRQVKIGEEYVNGGYEKKCKEENKKVDVNHLNRAVEKLKEKQLLLNEYEAIYNTCYTLIRRHEGTIHELARIYVGLRDDVFWQGEMPSQLMAEQVKMMKEYFESIKKILKPCKLDEK